MFVVVLVSKNFKYQDAGTVIRPATKADIGIEGLSFIQTRMGQIEWKITAKSAELFELEHLAALKDARVLLRTPQGLEISFNGDKGTINTDNHDFRIEKQVEEIKIEMSNGYTILTRNLVWRSKEHEIASDQPVRILGPGFAINGVGLLIKTLSQEFTIKEDVQLVVYE